jgi:hypothetical protein
MQADLPIEAASCEDLVRRGSHDPAEFRIAMSGSHGRRVSDPPVGFPSLAMSRSRQEALTTPRLEEVRGAVLVGRGQTLRSR